MHAVTRVEIVEAVKTAFTITAQPTVPRDLVQAATASGARPAVVTVLAGLDEDLQFRRLRELWEHFPQMPVNAADAE